VRSLLGFSKVLYPDRMVQTRPQRPEILDKR